MNEIDLYGSAPEQYEQLQLLRPDYSEAVWQSVNVAAKWLSEKSGLAVADFCSGVGNITKLFSERAGQLSKATLIDINPVFLDIARGIGIKADTIETIQKDVLEARLPADTFDVVFSVFAYHHVPDHEKKKYLLRAWNCLKTDSLMALTEIYMPDEETTNRYYEKLLQEIPPSKITAELTEFLTQTAQSKSFEFKVPKHFADEQLSSLGFQKLEEIKIWPTDNEFDESVGTFVTILKK